VSELAILDLRGEAYEPSDPGRARRRRRRERGGGGVGGLAGGGRSEELSGDVITQKEVRSSATSGQVMSWH
jgi:hypothetical protein